MDNQKNPISAAAIWLPIDKLKPAKDNPRINEHAINKIVQSIKSHGFTAPIIANFENEVLAGHTRLKAMKRLSIEDPEKYNHVPVRQIDLTGDKAKLYRIADNKLGELAEWDFSILEQQIKDLADDFDLTNAGFTETELNSFLFDKEENNALNEWVDMPEFHNEDLTSFRKIIVHFENEDAVNEFKKLVNQKISDKTKYIWYPEKQKNDFESKRY
tara:strand:- start:992 stop:1636 length:645 start_codon:yes stop_codon:yes gene_type:complete